MDVTRSQTGTYGILVGCLIRRKPMTLSKLEEKLVIDLVDMFLTKDEQDIIYRVELTGQGSKDKILAEVSLLFKVIEIEENEVA